MEHRKEFDLLVVFGGDIHYKQTRLVTLFGIIWVGSICEYRVTQISRNEFFFLTGANDAQYSL